MSSLNRKTVAVYQEDQTTTKNPMYEKGRQTNSPLLKHTFNNDNAFGKIFVRTVVNIDPDSDLFMNVAQKAYREHEKSLIQCGKCQRRFFPERIEQHQSSCNTPKLNVGKPVAVGVSRSSKVVSRTKKGLENNDLKERERPRWNSQNK